MKFFVCDGNRTYEVPPKEAKRLASQIVDKPTKKGTVISAASDVSAALQKKIGKKKVEHFVTIFVDHQNKILKTRTHSVGTEEQTAVYPKSIVRDALLNYATGVIIAHNHPTGNLVPSSADRDITRSVMAACKTCDIRFLDHIIVGNGTFSFREAGLID